MTFGKHALDFYRNLESPEKKLPGDVEIMNPLNDKKVIRIIEKFYLEYYKDTKDRIFLIGINPGRFGGGITGIPFTDPVNLENILGIKNDFEKRHELSSRFVYQVINELGGPGKFFGNFYLTAVSPLGYTSNDKNLNYYDIQWIRENWKPWFVEKLKEQIGFGARTDIAFSLGKGKNLDFLKKINKKAGLFKKIDHLPHPRWVMQYKYRIKEKYVRQYMESLKSEIESSE